MFKIIVYYRHGYLYFIGAYIHLKILYKQVVKGNVYHISYCK